MITTEIKINGNLIGYLYAHNVGAVNIASSYLDHLYNYEYKYYVIGKDEVVTGKVQHKRSTGAERLISIILKDIS